MGPYLKIMIMEGVGYEIPDGLITEKVKEIVENVRGTNPDQLKYFLALKIKISFIWFSFKP
tara:strand:- start:31 stop:213 length:183 start_codon:yes stop_codon:yes gene_type:complete